MPGGGKSTVGRLVAKRLGLPFTDADQAIEERAGCTISELFQGAGEAAFRDLEADVLTHLVASPGVVATGGGAVLGPANRELLRERTHCVYLCVPFETLMHRLRRDRKRPLLQVADPQGKLRELIAERDPLYQAAATATIDTAGLSLGRIVAAVIATLPAPLPGSGTP